MRTYLKSIGWALLGGILSLSLSFTLNSNNNSQSPTNNKGKINIPITNFGKDETEDSTHVPLDSAKLEVAAYQIWMNQIPETFSVDTSSMHETDSIELVFLNKKMSKEKWEIVKKYLQEFLKQQKISPDSFTNIPFNSGLQRAYYISLQDIDFIKQNQPNINGIHVYTALSGIYTFKNDPIATHLYVVGAIKENETTVIDSFYTINNKKYALDLTYPCPAMCDNNSPLNQPKLKPYSE